MIKQISLLLAHPWKNAFGHHLEKSTIAPLEKKTFLRPCSFPCRLGFLKLFCTCPTIHQTHHFAIPYPCQGNNTDKTIFSSFQLPKSFCISNQKFLDAGARSGAKKFRCLEPEPEPEIWVPAQQSCFRLLQPTIQKMHLLRLTYFSCFNFSKVPQNFVQNVASAHFGFIGHNRHYLGSLVGLMISYMF